MHCRGQIVDMRIRQQRAKIAQIKVSGQQPVIALPSSAVVGMFLEPRSRRDILRLKKSWFLLSLIWELRTQSGLSLRLRRPHRAMEHAKCRLCGTKSNLLEFDPKSAFGLDRSINGPFWKATGVY